MKVTEIIPYVRNASGLMLSGVAVFDDGKEWKWIRSNLDGSYFFVIDSGRPSQWSVGNYERSISPPNRITALIAKLSELEELTK